MSTRPSTVTTTLAGRVTRNIVTGKARVVLIDAVRRRVLAPRILCYWDDPCILPSILLHGDARLEMRHYKQTYLHEYETLWWLADPELCLEPRNQNYFYKFSGSVLAWRAMITSNIYGDDVRIPLHGIKREIRFIDPATARELREKEFALVEAKAAALSGDAVKRWRPWEANENEMRDHD
jgi:hypothetical protein